MVSYPRFLWLRYPDARNGLENRFPPRPGIEVPPSPAPRQGVQSPRFIDLCARLPRSGVTRPPGTRWPSSSEQPLLSARAPFFATGARGFDFSPVCSC
jgi:hypothetical protein